MEAPTPWRKLSYKKIATLHVKGKVIDLGGSRKSGYHELLNGSKDITVVNFDPHYGYDMKFNLEEPFPIQNKSYGTVLCINTLEHIYDYKHVLCESHRILDTSGKIIIVVPFIMFFHPCPHDYWRYTHQTLERILSDVGFDNIHVESIGKGAFLAAMQMIYPLLRFSVIRNIFYYVAWLCDAFVELFTDKMKTRYPLGYVVEAYKK